MKLYEVPIFGWALRILTGIFNLPTIIGNMYVLADQVRDMKAQFTSNQAPGLDHIAGSVEALRLRTDALMRSRTEASAELRSMAGDIEALRTNIAFSSGNIEGGQQMNAELASVASATYAHVDHTRNALRQEFLDVFSRNADEVREVRAQLASMQSDTYAHVINQTKAIRQEFDQFAGTIQAIRLQMDALARSRNEASAELRSLKGDFEALQKEIEASLRDFESRLLAQTDGHLAELRRQLVQLRALTSRVLRGRLDAKPPTQEARVDHTMAVSNPASSEADTPNQPKPIAAANVGNRYRQFGERAGVASAATAQVTRYMADHSSPLSSEPAPSAANRETELLFLNQRFRVLEDTVLSLYTAAPVSRPADTSVSVSLVTDAELELYIALSEANPSTVSVVGCPRISISEGLFKLEVHPLEMPASCVTEIAPRTINGASGSRDSFFAVALSLSKIHAPKEAIVLSHEITALSRTERRIAFNRIAALQMQGGLLAVEFVFDGEPQALSEGIGPFMEDLAQVGYEVRLSFVAPSTGAMDRAVGYLIASRA
ncbi:MAG: hypothetical protein ACOYJ6_14840 [Caulobacterales bacterium]